MIAPNNDSSIKAPVLMTPDAFINSPNNNKSLSSSNDQQSTLSTSSINKIDFLKTLMNTSGQDLTPTTNQSINILSTSRASSLTQVTNNNLNINKESMGIGSTNNLNNQPNNLNNMFATSGAVRKSRNDSSSSSSSSTSSSSSSSSQSADKEIAAVLSAHNNIINTKELMLLNKIELDNDTNENNNAIKFDDKQMETIGLIAFKYLNLRFFSFKR